MNGGRKRSLFGKLFTLIFGVLLPITALGVVALGVYLSQVASVVDPVGVSPTMDSSQVKAYMDAHTELTPEDITVGLSPEDIQWDSIPAGATDIADDNTHILIIGTDREMDGISRSDVIMLCSLNTDNRTMRMTSFLRDLYVPIPGFPDNPINAAYAFGGSDLLRECIHSNFGIRSDYVIEIGFEGFREIIDCLGGVELPLSEQEAEYLGLGEAGLYLLDGSQALSYVRLRNVGNADKDRTLRQQAVLGAIGPKIAKSSFPTMYKCLNKILPYVKTDLSISKILKLLPDVLVAANSQNCKGLQVPADGTYQDAWVAGMQVLIPDLEANRAVLKENIV